MKLGTGKRFLALATAAVIAVSPAMYHVMKVSADEEEELSELDMENRELDESTLVETARLVDSEIEKCTLIVGSYAIHIKGMTDSVYEQAAKSAETYNQKKMYYKSELADGRWFDVTDASSLDEIMTGGTPVEAREIEALEFTHKVSASGGITDLRYGVSISSFDIVSPYDLWELSQLEPLKNQYKLLEEKTAQTESDRQNKRMVSNFYEKSIENDTTKRYDNIIAGLEAYKRTLTEREKPQSWVTAVEGVMQHVDYLRRVEAFNILSSNLESLLDDVSGQTNECKRRRVWKWSWRTWRRYQTDVFEEFDFYVNSDLVAAVGESVQKVEESLREYDAAIRTPGSTTTQQNIYKYTNALMDSVKITTTVKYETYYPEWIRNSWEWQWYWHYNYWPWYYNWYRCWVEIRAVLYTHVDYDEGEADEATVRLVDIENITRNSIEDVSSELATVTPMIEQAKADYKQRLAAGVNEEYKNAYLAGAGAAALTQCLNDQKTETNASRLEYQSLLSAWFERMSSKSAQQTIERLINEIPEFEALCPADAVRSYHLETVADHEAWLREMLAYYMAMNGDSTQMDDLKDKLEELEEQRQQALDDDDLAGERRIAAEMEAVQQDIDDLTDEYMNIIKSPNSTPADKARAESGLGDGSTAGTIMDLARDIAESIRSGEAGSGAAGGNNIGTGDGSGAGTSGTGGNGTGEGGTSGTGDEGSGESGTSGTGDEGTGEGGESGTGDESSGEGGESGTGDEGSGTGGGSGTGDEGSGTGGSSSTGDEGSGTGSGSGTGGTGSGGGNGTGTGGTGSGSGTGGINTGASNVKGSADADIRNKLAALEGLAALDPDTASTALDIIEDAVDNASSINGDLLKDMQKSIGTIKRDIDGINKAKGLGTSDLMAILSDILGSDLKDASDFDVAGVVLALSRFGKDYRNNDAKNLAISIANDMYNNSNDYIYLKYAGDIKEYVSMRAAAAVLGYRYVFDDVHYSVTISRGRTYYTAKRGSAEYGYTGERSGSLKNAAVFQKTIYIETSDSKDILNVNAGYINGCDYAVVATPKVEARAAEVYNELVNRSRGQ